MPRVPRNDGTQAQTVTHSLGSYRHHYVDVSLPGNVPGDAEEYVILDLGGHVLRLTPAAFQQLSNCLVATNRRLFSDAD